MQSLCIKTNNNIIIDYLLTEFNNLHLSNLIITKRNFKYYNNVILHYTEKDYDFFNNLVSIILINTLIKFYEPKTIENFLSKNFMYFSKNEQNRIIEICSNEIPHTSPIFINKFKSLYNPIFDYIQQNHSILLKGFYNFRLCKYHKILSEIIQIGVNSYLIEREYLEFINILKVYVNSSCPITPLINLVFTKNTILLIDSKGNVINIQQDNFLNAKFLSDITFSKNDYILNYLLNMLPNKIIIHIPDIIVENDEFLETLKLIFTNRVKICRNCGICSSFF